MKKEMENLGKGWIDNVLVVVVVVGGYSSFVLTYRHRYLFLLPTLLYSLASKTYPDNSTKKERKDKRKEREKRF